jgi:hypothetical protein
LKDEEKDQSKDAQETSQRRQRTQRGRIPVRRRPQRDHDGRLLGSFENDTKVHLPLAAERWSAVGPGSIEITHFAKVSDFIAACIWLIAESPLTIMTALPEIEAAVRSI